MPKIELNLSARVSAQWENFLDTKQAGMLVEAGLLGDWVAQAFMSEVDHYLKEGLPQGPGLSAQEREDREFSLARKNLSKPQKRVLPMYNENDNQTAEEICRLLGLGDEEGEELIGSWVDQGFLALGALRDGQQTYVLSQVWQEINLRANRPSLNTPRAEHLPDHLKPTTKRG